MTHAAPTCVGVTGHQVLSETTRQLVRSAVRRRLERYRAVRGVTSLAGGADQLFARVVLALGGELLGVIPARNYESSFSSESDLACFRELLTRCTERVVLPYASPSDAAYWAAGREVVHRCEHMIAVWDGEPAAGLGGTAQVVGYAREHGKDVAVIWPAGASRG